jgi:hypothetical protein
MESIVAKLVTTEIWITGYTNMRKYVKYEYVEIRKCGYIRNNDMWKYEYEEIYDTKIYRKVSYSI